MTDTVYETAAERCFRTGIQNCSHCDDFECGDNLLIAEFRDVATRIAHEAFKMASPDPLMFEKTPQAKRLLVLMVDDVLGHFLKEGSSICSKEREVK